MPFSKEGGRQTGTVDKVRTVLGGAVKLGEHEREKKVLEPWFKVV